MARVFNLWFRASRLGALIRLIYREFRGNFPRLVLARDWG